MKFFKVVALALTGIGLGWGVVTGVYAAEHGGGAIPLKKAPDASAAPTQSTPTAQGSITALDLQSLTPTLTVKGAGDRTWTLSINPAATTVWNGTQAGSLSQLKLGEQVKVRYAEQGGRQIAKSVEIVPTPASATPTAESKPKQQ